MKQQVKDGFYFIYNVLCTDPNKMVYIIDNIDESDDFLKYYDSNQRVIYSINNYYFPKINYIYFYCILLCTHIFDEKLDYELISRKRNNLDYLHGVFLMRRRKWRENHMIGNLSNYGRNSDYDSVKNLPIEIHQEIQKTRQDPKTHALINFCI